MRVEVQDPAVRAAELLGGYESGGVGYFTSRGKLVRVWSDAQGIKLVSGGDVKTFSSAAELVMFVRSGALREGEPVRFSSSGSGSRVTVQIVGVKSGESAGSFELWPSQLIRGALELGNLELKKEFRGSDVEDRVWQAAVQSARAAGAKALTPSFANDSAATSDVERRMWLSKSAKKIGLEELEQLFASAEGYKSDPKWWDKKGLALRVDL